jgi:hypothetical protein
MAQMGFFDLSDRYASLNAKKDPLVGIDAVVPWDEFRPALEGVWRKPDAERKTRAGRRPIDAIVMFKALVLSALYNLSDDQIEYQLRDRLSHTRKDPRRPIHPASETPTQSANSPLSSVIFRSILAAASAWLMVSRTSSCPAWKPMTSATVLAR